MYSVFMSLIGNTRKLYTVNNLHAITVMAETTWEREIIKKIDSTTLYTFRKYKFCLLPGNKYLQNDSTFSLADQCILFSQKFDI